MPEPHDTVRSLTDLLNSWRIPNDTRVPVDLMPRWEGSHEWETNLPDWPDDDVDSLRSARDALRGMLAGDATSFNALVEECRPAVRVDREGLHIQVDLGAKRSSALVVDRVVQASRDGLLERLKVCPDCGWAFRDTTRNKSRVWCAMNAGPSQRGCGAIAKTQRHRARAVAS